MLRPSCEARLNSKMRLGEALQIAGQDVGKASRHVHLLCGCMPLHLATFLKAHLKIRFPDESIRLHSGLYGDLEGKILRACEARADGAFAIVEWSDLDARLGLRSSGGWGAQVLDDISTQAIEKCKRLESNFAVLANVMPVAVVAPTLSLPPLDHLPPTQTSGFELRLNAILIHFLERLAKASGIKLLNASLLAAKSPQSARHDVKMDLHAGFPYSLSHVDTMTDLGVDCLFAAPPKKGLITDLDQTLWKGILGDAGVEGVTWSLEDKSQAHGLYQQMLAALAESGVLIAIASKNDPKLVEKALGRSDILLRPEQVFPVEASWGVKSEAIGRILKAWNINADSVVFIDDSPMELAEVAEMCPGIECLQFPSNDPSAVVALLWELRRRFAKETVREEDRLRLQSLRSAAVLKEESSKDSPSDFVARLNAKLTFETSDANQARAFELVNKTNQFNLNGIRYTESQWKDRASQPGAFLKTVSYEDRFGPLGRIAVIGGRIQAERVFVDIWVMSCRAFSRQVELQVLKQLFARSGASELRFAFEPTERNGPLQTFFQNLFSSDKLVGGELILPATTFHRTCPALFHEVIET